MSNESIGHPVVGPVNQQWLDQVSSWLDDRDPSTITVLPRRITNGKAIYGDDVSPLVKWLRDESFDARFLNTPDHAFESRYGAVSDIVLSVLVNIGSSAAWDGFKYLLDKIRYRTSDMKSAGVEPQCTMSLGIVNYSDESSVMWQEISGPAEDVLHYAASIAQNYIAGNTDSPDAAIEEGASSDHSSHDAS